MAAERRQERMAGAAVETTANDRSWIRFKVLNLRIRWEPTWKSEWLKTTKLDRIERRQGRNRVSWELVHLHSEVLVSQNRDAAEHAKICFALIFVRRGPC